MELTESLVREYINEATDMLVTYKRFKVPEIVKIEVANVTSYWATIKPVVDGCNIGWSVKLSKIFERITDEELFHKRLLSCIVHEMIHTQTNCWNHGKRFQYWAQCVNTRFPQITIATSTDGRDFGIDVPSRSVKYHLICNKCGRVHEFRRMTAYLNDPNKHYMCGTCEASDFTFKKL